MEIIAFLQVACTRDTSPDLFFSLELPDEVRIITELRLAPWYLLLLAKHKERNISRMLVA